jgi:hydrogenase expression/formation protein HypD
MRYVTEYRNQDLAQKLITRINKTLTKSWAIMEICGGQTHAFMRYGLDELLPGSIELIHGPGCPVCVTPLELIDKAIAIASLPGVIFATFGDMLRVPGSDKDLFTVRANGGQVRVVYSPLDAVKLAIHHPDKQVVFFAIGFETTAPVNAVSVIQAQALNLKNYSVLVSQVCVPPAMHAILGSPNNRVQAFLAAGHVCSVMGYWQYHSIAEKYSVPIIVTGFEPVDLLSGLLMAVEQLEKHQSFVQNAYPRVVTEQGNRSAQKMIDQVFFPADRNWRGIGTIPISGLGLRPEFADFNAELRFDVRHIQTKESTICQAGDILQGIKKPPECPAFGTLCTPERPLGAPMVSSEGACSAFYRFRRN